MRERERESNILLMQNYCQDATCQDARMPGYSRMGCTINIQLSDVSMIERERESNIPRS